MEYRYSTLIHPTLYDTDGLFEGIPVRVHRNTELDNRGALRAQKDWKRLFGSLPAGFVGSLGPEYNLTSSWLPETLPNRIELVAYLSELVFLLDDLIESAESPASVFASALPDMLQAFRAVMEGGGIDGLSVSSSPIGRLIMDSTKAMLAVDPEQTRTAYRHLERWVQAFPAQGSKKDFCNLDDYLEYRSVNMAAGVVFGFAIFAMGLSIPEDQQQICLDLSRPVFLHISLANDCRSWEMKDKAVRDKKQAIPTNGIWVLMEKHSMSLDEAQSACRARARRFAAEYLQTLESEQVKKLGQPARALLDALKFAMSGNVVWGLQSPWYQPNRTLNATQLEKSKTIAADPAVGWYPNPTRHANDTGDHRNGIITKVLNRQVTILREAPILSHQVLDAPSRYLDSLPSKGIRDKIIDALNTRLKVPSETTEIIKRVVNLLHGASLLMDDVQDMSELRRGSPATHLVFGLSPTINAAGYRFLQALIEVRKLNERCLDVFCDELRDLYVGQSHDLTWTRNLDCPSEAEYLAMVGDKTGGLFRMLARMLDAMSDSPTKPDVSLLTRFMTMLGQLFQIRDDYMNLTSADYTKQKGFCEDLDEGKYSLPLIHALGRTDSSGVIQNLLSQRRGIGRLSIDQKKLLLQHIKDTGSLEYTRQALDVLQAGLKSMVKQMGMAEEEEWKELFGVLKV